jgi:malate synthase
MYSPRYERQAGLQIHSSLFDFIEQEVLPDIEIPSSEFWRATANIFEKFSVENARLLKKRRELQKKIDAWHSNAYSTSSGYEEYENFLREIGYLVEEPSNVKVDVTGVDEEVSSIAGPQLVVPVLNERFALNAANARWGSLYDALYGTDAIPGKIASQQYDAARGADVIKWARRFLDETIPLASGSHADVTKYFIENHQLQPRLAEPNAFIGFRGAPDAPNGLLFKHNGLHLEISLDRNHPVGKSDKAGITDIVLEAALTTIVDFEDSVATVDPAEKVQAYRNWLGLLRGTLEARFEKDGRLVQRVLAEDRTYTSPEGKEFRLQGRSLLLVRNVGLLTTTPAVRSADGQEVPEGILDAIVTSAIALIDLKRKGRYVNSKSGSIYIVKPKLHGPEEVAYTCTLFGAVEQLLGIKKNTIKIGIMDEERRTSANLAAVIQHAKSRVFFINTGFLDRTGDEIHTSLKAGPLIRKSEMKSSTWLKAYEERNVCIGLLCGLKGRAQIGKGMWAMPDRMADMLREKIAHPLAGASTAWVPSPTAATLHATHYHAVDVSAIQDAIDPRNVPDKSKLLTIPLASHNWNDSEIQQELENNAQSILGYVSRWVQQGVGCSKVPDIHDVGLMEDRATLRISSQIIANWLYHGICTQDAVECALKRMAAKVDAQNASDPHYSPMAGFEQESLAYSAARELIFEGAKQPSGYTELVLMKYRRLQIENLGSRDS